MTDKLTLADVVVDTNGKTAIRDAFMSVLGIKGPIFHWSHHYRYVGFDTVCPHVRGFDEGILEVRRIVTLEELAIIMDSTPKTPTRKDFLSELSKYVDGMEEETSEKTVLSDELFVDKVTARYKLDNDSEAILCASITYIRSVATLIQ
jgi:hypothetical protein